MIKAVKFEKQTIRLKPSWPIDSETTYRRRHEGPQITYAGSLHNAGVLSVPATGRRKWFGRFVAVY